MIRTLNGLQREAARATTWRAHRMRWSTTTHNGKSLRVGICVRCGMEVTCRTEPAPNSIDIGGEAVALNCTGKVTR